MTWRGWDERNVAELTRLWGEGQSANQIMRAIGAPTRNAVIGKVARLGLTREPGAKRTSLQLGGAKGAREQRRTYPKVSAEDRGLEQRLKTKLNSSQASKPTSAIRLVVEAPTEHSRRLTDLGFGQCRWPLDMSLGEATAETLFCAAPIPGEEGSFCPVHRARVYVKPKEVGSGYSRSLRRYVAA